MSVYSIPLKSSNRPNTKQNNNIPHHLRSPPSSSNKRKNVNRYMNYDPEKEPIKAYLRIRPPPPDHLNKTLEEPYIKVLDNTEVLMTPPEDSKAYRSRHRDPEKYRFTHIFQNAVDQETFYKETTLELVKDVLSGNDALIFAYGVTNSGKTYTVMGHPQVQEAGLLPRTLNTLFSSIQGFESDTKLKPYMHSLIQTYDQITDENRHLLNNSNNDLYSDLHQQGDENEINRVEIESNYEYGIWVSFIEIYNEHVYDLLDRATSNSSKRKQLQLKYEQRSGNRYVADAKLVKVKTVQEALSIMQLGQQNRQVFSTLMNQCSSRSHSVFTIHVVRCPIDADNYVIEDPQYAHISKFSVVDLAGSERYRNTNSTGERLKEAGNINKSLMVLGQCMEVLRINQIKAEMGKSITPVPFRHSKLTELFKSTFEGHGKAAIIVNVNPFDTGFDENIHVMRFAAVAKEVNTWRQARTKLDLQDVQPAAKRIRHGFEAPQEEEEEVEEDLNEDDGLVDGLTAQLEEIWEKWMEAESRATSLEFEIREQVSRETDAELRKMEEMYLLALKRENEMINSRLNQQAQNDEDEDSFLSKVQERQTSILEELDNLKEMMNSYNLAKQTMADRISELEKQNKKERERSEYLQEQLEKKSSTQPSAAEEDEEETEDTKENEDPNFDEKYSVLLDLRKQLRRSVFKKEELSKDADDILTQVEQFDGVSFKLAKETKMGKLLKLIAQEEFERDPYLIRNRALRLFKKYALLPTNSNTPSSAQHAFSTMSISESDAYSLREENARLRQKIKSLTNGQKRLKEAFEKTKIMRPISDDTSMKDAEESTSFISQGSSLTNEDEGEEEAEEGEEGDEYESDITEMLKSQQRHKRRRKLRARS